MAKDMGVGITISLRDNLSSGAKKAGNAIEGLKKQSEGGVNSLNKMQRALNAAAGSQLMSGAKQAFNSLVESSRGFEREMAQVSTQLDTNKVNMAELTKGVEAMSVKFGTDAVTEAKGFYEVLSAGIGDEAQSLKALEVANRMAIGGNAELGASVDGLTTIINAWGISADKADHIADTLFTTVKLGKLNMEDLARNIADVAPLASSLGIDLEQVGASIATMTKQGTRAPIAFTQMKAAIVSLLRPTDDLTRVWRRAGFRDAEAAIRARGYQGALQLLMKATKGSKGELIKLLGSSDAANAVLQVSGEKASLFAQSLKEVKDSAGAADVAFRKASETNDFRMKQADQAWEKMKRTVGTQMLIALQPAIEKFSELAKIAGDWLEKNPAWAKAIGLTVAGLVALAFVLGILAVAIFVVEAVSSPVILIILAIAAAIAVVIAIVWYFKPTLLKAWEWVKSAVSKIGAAFKRFGIWVAEIFTSAYDAVLGWVKGIGELFKSVWEWLKRMASKFLEFVESIPFLGDSVKALRKTLEENSEIGMSATITPAWLQGAGAGPGAAAQDPENMTRAQRFAASARANSRNNPEIQAILGNKNPNTVAGAPIQNQVNVNLPKTVVNPASVQIDKREIAKVVFDVQQQEGVRQ